MSRNASCTQVPLAHRSCSCPAYASAPALIALAKMAGLVVTPTTWSRPTKLARLPLVSRSRLRSSSQMETPALLSSQSRSVMIMILSGVTLRVGRRLVRYAGQGEELGPAGRVGPQRAQQGRSNRLGAVRPHAAQRHAGVLGLQHHVHPRSAQAGRQALGHLLRDPSLAWWPGGEVLHQPAWLDRPNEPSAGR